MLFRYGVKVLLVVLQLRTMCIMASYDRTNPIHGKLGTYLTTISDVAKGIVSPSSHRYLSGIKFHDKVTVDIVGVSNEIDLSTVLHNANITGLHIFNCYPQHICSVLLPPDMLEDVASIDEISFFIPAISGGNKGSVISEGDYAMFSNVARSKFSVSGEGILIGVLSDSFNCIGTASNDILTGDLPSNVVIVQDLDENLCNQSGSDEGRAMMQIIHDVAPGARIAFRTATRGIADFAFGILELERIGCDIIVDDWYYSFEPFFQDGIIAQAVDHVVSRGVAYFSAAGNDYKFAWDEPNGFDPVNTTEGIYHAFRRNVDGTPIIHQKITVGKYGKLSLVLQWDQPFSSLGSDNFCQNDIGLELYMNGDWVSFDDNNIGHDPVEFVPSMFEVNEEASYKLRIKYNKRDDFSENNYPGHMKIVCVSCFGVNLEFGSVTSTIFGHSNAAYGCGVGAANFSRTPYYNISPPEIEVSSSQGGTPIFFDKLGNRKMVPIIRKQPRITAPDGVSNTFFGDNNNFFYGTSAAAPHAAAVAALLLDANGGSKSFRPAEIYSILQNTAIDMDDPNTDGEDNGFDFATGYGFVNASAAVYEVFSLKGSPPTTSPSKNETMVQSNTTQDKEPAVLSKITKAPTVLAKTTNAPIQSPITKPLEKSKKYTPAPTSTPTTAPRSMKSNGQGQRNVRKML